MAQYYAYSPIRYDDGVIEQGEKVDQKTLGVSDEEWESMINDNVVIDHPIPEDLGTSESLTTYYLRKSKEEFEAAQAGVVQSKAGEEAATKAQELTKNE